MGVLEFFGTLIKSGITATSIRSNFIGKIPTNYFLLDFNSIIHVSSQKILSDVNGFMQSTLKNLYAHRSINILSEIFTKYKMEHVQKKITLESDALDVITMFKEHFNEKFMDKLIIVLVINNILHLVKTYCENQNLKTLLLAIDGVPSKGKMIEQKQRRYMGTIMEEYKEKILTKYADYLLAQPDYQYLTTNHSIKWSRNKITPGTAFMHKLVKYLNSPTVQTRIKINRPNLDIIISDMYQIGEGEKKIMNYIDSNVGKDEEVMVYSPDADMILLCMLAPIQKIYVLRHNQQTSEHAKTNIYDLVDIQMLKSNISFYINNHEDYPKAEFEINRINNDIVCMATLFGNDFVPKIETINVKSGFQTLMDAYLKTLVQLKEQKRYLIKKINGGSKLSLTFLKTIIKHLLPEENYFIKHNNLYNQYVTMGQIKNVFDYMEINSENIVSTVTNFKRGYDDLKNLIKHNSNLTYYETHDQFMTSLKKSLVITIDEQPTNTSYLSNKELIKVLRDYYMKYKDFPRLNINLNTWSHSITDYKHKLILKEKKYNDYQKEVYQFEKMLDNYYIKFNAQPLVLTRDKIKDYYLEYFGVEINTNGTNSNADANAIGKDVQQVMHSYLEGMLWVFNYYFNDKTYINKWYYQYERAPLLKQLLLFLSSITPKYFDQMFQNLETYQVTDLKKYFNPVEQLIYVSPMVPSTIKLLPSNYAQYLESDNLDPFLRNYFVNIKQITSGLWKEKICRNVDCHSIIYFNKCLIKAISKPTEAEDVEFLKAIRKVKPNEVSRRRSKVGDPVF